MTTDDRLERVLPDVLASAAPLRAPDGLRRDVLSTTSRLRQRQRWRVLPANSLRFQTMSSTLKLTAVAVLALAVGIGVAPFLVPPVSNVATDPSPSPSFGPVPTELQNEWVGSHREVEGLDTSTDQALALKMTSVGFSLFRPWDRVAPERLRSAARATPDGRLELSTILAGDGCEVGDAGLYAWTYAAPERQLTIEPGTDDCATRAAAVPGTWVGKGDGCNPGQWCLGDLAPGTHATSWFAPRGMGGDAYRAKLGALTYTVPEGWKNTLDDRNGITLVPTAASPVAPDTSGNVNPDQIQVHGQPMALSSDSLCASKADPAVGQTMNELATFLEGHPGLVVKASQDITIDGHPGRLLDIDIAPTWTATCKDWPEFSTYVPVLGDGRDDSWWMGPAGRPDQPSSPVRIVLLDIGGGDVATVFVGAYDPADQAALVEQAMPIIESFRFAD